MDRATVQHLRDMAEQRCIELFNQSENAKVELERTRGDFRTYEGLLRSWPEEQQIIEPEIIQAGKESDKTSAELSKKTKE